jgi:DNA-binding protein H-NS
MATLQELIAQKEALEREIEKTTAESRSKAIEQIRALMAENGLTPGDLMGGGSTPRKRVSKGKSPSSGSKVAAKYRNASTGESWSGRGLQPRWLKAALESGKKLEDFAV